MFFGAYESQYICTRAFIINGTSCYHRQSSNSYSMNFGTPEIGKKYNYRFSCQHVKDIDNDLADVAYNSTRQMINVANVPVYLFNAIEQSIAAPLKLYSFKIHNGTEIVLDLIPAKDTSGVVGMYDKISETFFYNAGTGDFIAGPEV